MKQFFFAASALLASAAGAVLPADAADAVTPSAIVAGPAGFEGKAVSVSGTVAQYQTHKSLLGTVAAFQLCDSKCIVVIDQTNAGHKDGDKITVDGTFQSTFKGPQRSFKNVVVIK